MKTEYRNSGHHLTEREISQWLVEGPQESSSRHVQDCSACEMKLTEAQAPLAAFRGALVAWSEAQTAPPLPGSTSLTGLEARWVSRLWLPAAGFVLAALLLVGYTRVPALLHGTYGAQTLVAIAPVTDSDEALLSQVDTEVSEAVPDAMAPLTDLVSWDSTEGSATQTVANGKHAVRKTSTTPEIARALVHVTD